MRAGGSRWCQALAVWPSCFASGMRPVSQTGAWERDGRGLSRLSQGREISGVLHGAGADGYGVGAALRLVDIGLHLGIGQRVGRALLAGRGRENDADHAPIEVDQRTA